MSVPHHSRSSALAYEAAGMEPPPPVPLKKTDPTRVGPYALMSVLGSGGMGRVYLGQDTTGGSGLAAVKVIRPEYAEDPQFRKRFEREVGALDRVQGAHIVRLLGSGCDEDLVWVATEYVPGPTLAELVDARGPIDATAAWRLLADLGRAVEAIWRVGIVHRDLKPSNVILASDGARVIDFGVVQATDGTSITVTGQNVGTPAFMSPEQVRGKEVTAASDIFALASALAYAVTGQAPFGEGTGVDVLHRVAFEPPKEEVLEKAAAVDTELAAFIRTCLDKEPESRPSPETVFRTAIGHQFPAPTERSVRSAPKAPLLDGRPTVAPAPAADPPAGFAASDSPATPAPGRRRKLIVGAAATVAVAVAAAVTVALLPQSHSAATAAPGPDTSATGTGNSASTTSSSHKAPTSSPSQADQADQAAEQSPSAAVTKDSATQGSGTPDLRTTACPAELVSGATGACAKALQILLDGHGLYVPVSGDFDAATVAAVRAFQTEAGLTVDGKVGAQTRKLLYALPRGTVQAGSVTVTESVNAVSVARCLDNRGSDVQVWECNGTDAQKWALYRVAGQGSQYRVVNRGSHLCLDAGTTGRNGQEIQATSCDGLSAQTWQLGGGGTLVSVPDGFCLDAEASTSGQDGQRVQGFGCAGSTNQVWHWS
ncbi:protein kinase [Streptomyces sp. LUP47B]|uniref:protein kinase domain-containing protein n=1 Tax=Streptomyces sp. LUP47B TaxID=1890286 RepID=UPI000AE81AB5|nr:protein kinase [Streptomyces sp. LUP47B]